jgi:ADP-ribose pyrophosphatase YjhB (NUDIX family)
MEHKKIGAGVIAIDKKTGDILLGRRSFQSPSPNTWSPFGGTYESNKDLSPKDTAKREFGEETGGEGQYEMLTSPFYIQDTPKLTFYNYIGIANDKFPVNINKEHITYGWFPLDYLPSNLHPGFQELISHKKPELESIINKIKTKEDEN